MCNPFRRPARSYERDCQVPVSFPVARIQSHGGAQLLDGFGNMALHQQDRPQIVPQFRGVLVQLHNLGNVARIQLNSYGKLSDGLVHLRLHQEGGPEGVMGLGIAGVECDGPGEMGPSFIQPAQVEESAPEVNVRLVMVWEGCQNGVKAGDGLFPMA